LATLAQVDERRTRAHLVRAIHADLVRELETVEARLRQLQSAGGQPEMDALCQYLVRVREVQQKARVYTELLGARVQDIQARLGSMQADVQRLVLFNVDELLS
jgi:NADH:ubiquinone oxidoreductase subunit D